MIRKSGEAINHKGNRVMTRQPVDSQNKVDREETLSEKLLAMTCGFVAASVDMCRKVWRVLSDTSETPLGRLEENFTQQLLNTKPRDFGLAAVDLFNRSKRGVIRVLGRDEQPRP